MSNRRTRTTSPEALSDEQLEALSGGMRKGELIERLYEHEAAEYVTAPGGDGAAAGAAPSIARVAPPSPLLVAKKTSDG